MVSRQKRIPTGVGMGGETCGARAPGGASERHKAPRKGRAGFGLIEALISTTVVIIAVGGMSAALVSGLALRRTNSESAEAQAAARRAMERVRGVAFTEAFARFNANPADDPGGAGTAPGANFAAPGLSVPSTDADGMAGSIEFPTIVVGGVAQLREDCVDASLGMPRDLNGDGIVDAANHFADYRVLPVRVRVAWTGVNGRRTLTLETNLCER